MRTLSHDEARRVYDRIGARQDTQAFYEDRASDVLVAHGRFEEARSVFELGCGTGRLAERLLSAHLPDDARYRAVDLSPTMVGLACERLAPFGERAEVVRTDGGPPTDEPTGATDRFVSTFVLDLLSEEEIAACLAEAHRMLVPGGLLCLASLSTGEGPGTRLVARLWSAVHRLHPVLVGGCRPIALAGCLPTSRWTLRHREALHPLGIPLEALVAERV